MIVSLAFFLVVVVGGYFFLSSGGEKMASAEPEFANDPLITGQYRSGGWIVLNLVGGLIAVPFILVRGLISGLESVEKSTGAANTTTAIEPANTSKSVSKTSGD
jgi:hypothetical protein